MKASTPLLVTALLLITSHTLGRAAEEYVVRRSPEGWSLVVKPYDTPAGSKPRFWVGVQNDTDTTKAVCLASVRYVLEDQSGSRVSEGVEGFSGALGVPPCPDPHSGHLVRSREAVFVLVQLPSSAEALNTSRLSFEVMLVEHCLTSSPCERQAGIVRADVR